MKDLICRESVKFCNVRIIKKLLKSFKIRERHSQIWVFRRIVLSAESKLVGSTEMCENAIEIIHLGWEDGG